MLVYLQLVHSVERCHQCRRVGRHFVVVATLLLVALHFGSVAAIFADDIVQALSVATSGE